MADERDQIINALEAEQRAHEETKRQLAEAQGRVAELEDDRNNAMAERDGALSALERETAEHLADMQDATRTLRTIRARANRMIKRNPEMKEWWAQVDAAAAMADAEEAHPGYCRCHDVLPEALRERDQARAALAARTRQVERWQHADHAGCASDGDGGFICEPATPGDFARMANRCRDAEGRLAESTLREGTLRAALGELYAQVKGECPSLLNEDSGGDARLDMQIEAVLATPTSGTPLVDAVRALVDAVAEWMALGEGQGSLVEDVLRERLAPLVEVLLPGIKQP